MNKKNLLLLFLLALLTPFASLAQSLAVSGKVISGDDGYGLPGVTVQVRGTQTGTVTDMDGNYSLTADRDDVLVFSFVGYKSKEVAVKGKTKINVTLESDNQLLDDVVVTALGIKRQKRELGYATEEIGGEMIAKSATVPTVNRSRAYKESRSCAISVVAMQDTNNTIANTFFIV